jgi:hypothetical protein
LSSISSTDRRWHLVVPIDAVVVIAGGDQAKTAATRIAALPPSTRVAIVGPRKVMKLAHRNHVKVEKTFVVLPSLDVPVVVAQVARESLDYLARSFMTVPPGQARFHGPVSFVLRVIRWRPRLLLRAHVGDRIVIGVRQ